MSEMTLHDRLDREHTDALLRNYSADYEAWLEDKVEELQQQLADYRAFAEYWSRLFKSWQRRQAHKEDSK